MVRAGYVCRQCPPSTECRMETVECLDCGQLCEGLTHSDLVRDRRCNPCFHRADAERKSEEKRAREAREKAREGWRRA